MPSAHKRRRLSPTLLPGCRALCPASSPASRVVYSAGLLDSLVPLPETRKKRTFPGAQIGLPIFQWVVLTTPCESRIRFV